MNLQDIVPGRFYSFVYEPAPSQWCENNLKKGGRGGLPENPLFGRVSVRKVTAGQAASASMYEHKAKALNPAWIPSDREPLFEATEHPCVVRSNSNGELQVRLMNPRTVRCEYFVDGRPATDEELATIKMYGKARRLPDPTRVAIRFPYLESLSNVDGTLPEDGTEDD